ncbi:MAG: hypothetical protein IPN95_29275 [Bacteroidetes bacterium]|nr:hypothetical protein [Bacteroidota bacterium]
MGKRRSPKIARVSAGRSQSPTKGGAKLPAIINPNAIHTSNCIFDLLLQHTNESLQAVQCYLFCPPKENPRRFRAFGDHRKMVLWVFRMILDSGQQSDVKVDVSLFCIFGELSI